MKKKAAIFYIIYFIFCFLYWGFQAGQYTEQVRGDQYGLSTDDTVELNADSVIASEFEVTGDTLQGISVKFQAEERFQDEMLRASLFDCGSDELLATNAIELKYERVQNKDGGSSIYFELPVEGAKGRQVRLELTLEGEAVHVQPSFVVSDSKGNESVLLADGERMDGNLVFSVRYRVGKTRDLPGAVMGGLLWMLAGTLIFVYLCTGVSLKNPSCGQRVAGSGRAGKDTAAMAEAEPLGKVCIFQGRFRKAMGYILLTGSLGFIFIYVYKFSVAPVIYGGEYGDVFFLKKSFVVLCGLLLVSATIFYAVCFVYTVNLEQSFAATALILGVVFGLVIGLNTVPDEPSHIDTAYAVSNELLGIEESTRPGYIYKRACDVDMAAEEKQSLDVHSYERLYAQIFTMAEDETLVECAARSNLGNAGRIYYLPQALGITAGRLLGLGMMPTMLLGRLFSLIGYVLLTYLALKKLPIGKLSLFLIGILPITLQQAASFSYDGMINGITFLYVSYCLYGIYGETEPSVSDIVVLVITGCMVADVKGGVYVALCLLPLASVWMRREMSCRQKWSMAALTGVMLFAFAGKRFASILIRFTAVQGTVVGGAASTEVYTFGYIIEHPLRFIGMFMNTFYKQGDAYLRNLLGGNLGWREVNINWTVIFGFLLVILLSCIVTGKEKHIGVKDKLCFGGISMASFFCVELSMMLVWTPVTYQYITGVQGRYFLPFFLLVLLVLRGSFVSLKKNVDRQLIFAAGLLNIVTVLQVIQKVLG